MDRSGGAEMQVSKYNPFNGDKALKHVRYWQPIKEMLVPPPILVSLDLCGKCNLKCTFCNAGRVKDGTIMSRETMDRICRVLSNWRTKAVCLGGGGESSINPDMMYVVEKLNNIKIKVGLITNGVLFPRIIPRGLDWIGVSVDAATRETYKKIKGCDRFDRVIDNIQLLKGALPKTEITFKYLLHPLNEKEVYRAIQLASEIGCNRIHIRPGSYAWFDTKGKQFEFRERDYEDVESDVRLGKTVFEINGFTVHAVTEKFNRMFKPKLTFDKCYAGFTTCYFAPDGKVGLCCDRRGDRRMMLGNVDTIEALWGSKKHFEIINRVDVKKCPRCTYSHVNQIFENVIMEDRMMCDFI